ncbi:MAG: hypothetical protein ABIG66_03000 [Candidatus Kerfeldbacteria bacterium]
MSHDPYKATLGDWCGFLSDMFACLQIAIIAMILLLAVPIQTEMGMNATFVLILAAAADGCLAVVFYIIARLTGAEYRTNIERVIVYLQEERPRQRTSVLELPRNIALRTVVQDRDSLD